MFWNKQQESSLITAGCCLTENGYSLSVVKNNKQLLFSQSRVFNSESLPLMSQTLAEDVERFDLIGRDCQLILLPNQYQLISMDALDLPDTEMAKALRWNLKGLSDYDLDDVAIDTCLIPRDDTNDKQKVFVALTPLTVLNQKRALFESVFLNIKRVTIAEMALKNVLPLLRKKQVLLNDAPIILISIQDGLRKLYIVYKDLFYLIRELTATFIPNADEPAEVGNMLFEIERSIDYCVEQLSLPRPQQLFLTPGFHASLSFLKPIEENLSLTIFLINLNDFLDMEQLMDINDQQDIFYSVTGALKWSEDEWLV